MQKGKLRKRSEMKVIVCSCPDTRYYAQAIRWNVAKGIKSRFVFLILIFIFLGTRPTEHLFTGWESRTIVLGGSRAV